MSTESDAFECRSDFDALPDNLVLEICRYLSHDDLYKFGHLCTKASRIASDKSLWRRIRFDEPVPLRLLHSLADRMFIRRNPSRRSGQNQNAEEEDEDDEEDYGPREVHSFQITGYLGKYKGKPKSAAHNLSISLLTKLFGRDSACAGLKRLVFNECLMNYVHTPLYLLPKTLKCLELRR